MDVRTRATELLVSGRTGDGHAVEALMPLVYDELRAIAHGQLRRERADHTLGTTALVHEAYLKLIDQRQAVWQDRTHFFSIAARAMRRILIDYARKHVAAKRGGGMRKVALEEAVHMAASERADELLAIDDALRRLAALDERQAKVVEYRFFGGMTEEETAQALGITSRTVRRDWIKARGWLQRELSRSAGDSAGDGTVQSRSE